MTDAQLEGVWLNGHIRKLLAERRAVGVTTNGGSTNGVTKASENGAGVFDAAPEEDQTTKALEDAVLQAEKGVEAARYALLSYVRATGSGGKNRAGAQRRGPTSRELSGEMGGDTIVC